MSVFELFRSDCFTLYVHRPNISKANIFGLLFKRFKNFIGIDENAYLKKYSNLQQGTHKIGLLCYFNVSAVSHNVMKIRNHYNKNPNIFAFFIFGLKCFFIPLCHVKAVQDGISSKTVRYYCITLYDYLK